MRKVVLAALWVAAAPIVEAENTWLKRGWQYRVRLTVNAGQYPRIDKPAEVRLNFTEMLRAAGLDGVFNTRSLRLLEVDEQDRVIDRHAVMQFNPDENFSPAANASGELIALLKGRTEANETRNFHLYFELGSRRYSTFPYRPLVKVEDEVQHEGQASYRIQTRRGTYLYHKQGGGFASLFDLDGNDWIGYRPGGRAAGEFRGIPNLGSCFHPGYTNSTSRIVHQGPLKATIYSETNDKAWAATWEIFPTYARMTVLKRGGNYWFLYEGTPGGKLDLDSDYLVTASGQQQPITESWAADMPGPEWIYFGDTNLRRVLYLVHHQDDDAPDQYWQMNGEMTVFGFGRQYRCCEKYLDAVPNQFTIGLAETSSHAAVVERINSSYQPLTVEISPIEVR